MVGLAYRLALSRTYPSEMHPIEHLRHVARSRSLDDAELVREAAIGLGSIDTDGPDLVVACRRIVERHPEVGALWWLCARLLVSDAPGRLAWRIAEEIGSDRTPRVVARELPERATVLTIGWPAVAGSGLVRRGDVRVLCADSRHRASGFVRQLERADVECDLVEPESLARAAAVADLVLLDVVAATPSRILAPIGSHVVAAVAATVDTPVWCVFGLGRRLPVEYVDAIAQRVGVDADPLDARSLEARSLEDRSLGVRSLDVDVDDLPVSLIDVMVSSDGISSELSSLRAECPFAPELLRASPI